MVFPIHLHIQVVQVASQQKKKNQSIEHVFVPISLYQAGYQFSNDQLSISDFEEKFHSDSKKFKYFYLFFPFK